MKVAIIGAGICGLAAGWILNRDSDHECDILEIEDDIGGLCGTIKSDGCLFDYGPHRLHTTIPFVENLVEEICGDNLVRSKRKSRIYLRKRFFDYPLRASELAFRINPLRNMHFALSYAWTKMSSPFADPFELLTYEGFITRRFGKAMFDYFFGPYTEKVYGVKTDQISSLLAKQRIAFENLSEVIKKLLKGDKSDKSSVTVFKYPKDGVIALPRKFAADIEASEKNHQILCGSNISMIRENDEGKIEITYEREGQAHVLVADKLISTIPPASFFEIFRPQPDDKFMQMVKSFNFRAIILLYIILDKPDVSDDTWLYFPDPDMFINRGYEPKNFYEGTCPPDRSAICLEVTCDAGDEIWRMSDKDIYDKAMKDIDKTGLFKREDVRSYATKRIPQAYPVYDLAHRIKLNKMIEYLKDHPDILFTGRNGLFVYNNSDHSIDMGARIAKYIIDGHDDPELWYKQIAVFDEYRVVD
jgi:protoporphyrinogen oxidase